MGLNGLSISILVPLSEVGGQIGEWPEHIENGSSATIEAYIYSTVIGENRAWFRSTAVDPDVATASRLSYSAQIHIFQSLEVDHSLNQKEAII